MASEEEDDLEALRLAALATLKKKPSAAEDAQPIPQLTSSGHSLHNSKSPWAEDFNYDSVPFENEQPIPQFPSRTWEEQQLAPTEFRQNSPTHYSQNNWRGRGRFQRPYMHGPFQPNQRAPFGQNRLPFGSRMQFGRIQRPPFSQNARLPFNPAQRPPSFNQNPLPFPGATLPFGGGGGSGGGGGNLIVINTLPEEGEQPKGAMPQGQQLPFPGGTNHRGGPGRGGIMNAGRGMIPGRGRGLSTGRGGTNAGVGPGGNLPPLESSSKPVLLRPQDKYCPSSETVSQVPETAPVHRKKKDKFSRYDSSGSDSDDESEEDSEDEQPSRPLFVPANEEEEMDEKATSDNLANSSHEEQPSADIPDADISVTADKEEEQEFDELEEPVSGLDNLGEVEEVKEATEPELNEEEEEKLLALSPARDSSEDNPSTAINNSPKNEQHSPRESSPKNLSPSGGSEKGDESDIESSSDNDSESGNESDTSSSSSSSSASNKSDKDVCGSGSQKNSESENEEEEKDTENSSLHQDSDEFNQASDSHSDSEEETSIRRLPSKPRLSTSPRRSPSPKKTEKILTPEQQARLEARRRKFESSQEVQLTGNKKISLKGIVPKTNKKTKSQRSCTPLRKSPPKRPSSPQRQTSPQRQSVTTYQRQSSVSVSKTIISDSHRKRSKRKVSLESPVAGKPSNDSEEKLSESEEDNDDEEDGSRSWMREGKRKAVHRKTVNMDKPLPGFGGSYRGNTYQRGSRNGGYHQQGYEPSRDTRPEIHYSSSEEEEEDTDRKLISVVVPRSSAGTHIPTTQSRERDSVRTTVSNRKRIGGSGGGVSHGGDRSSVSKSKHFQDSGSFNVVITDDPVPPKRSRADANRRPVHERLGKGSQQQKDLSSRGKSKPSKRVTSGSDEEGESGHTELDQRIRRIKQNNAAIIRRQEEVRQDRELYG